LHYEVANIGVIMSERDINNRIDYFICCIGAFAKQFAISNAEAYRYLQSMGGMRYLYDNYEYEHTQSIEDAVEDMGRICMRHGGALLV